MRFMLTWLAILYPEAALFTHTTQATTPCYRIVIPTLARAHFLRQCLDDLDKIATEDCEEP